MSKARRKYDDYSDDEYEDDGTYIEDEDFSDSYYDNDDFNFGAHREKKKKKEQCESDDEDVIEESDDAAIKEFSNEFKEKAEYSKDETWWTQILDNVRSGDKKRKTAAQAEVIELLDRWIEKIAHTRFKSFLPRDWDDLIQTGRYAVLVHLPEYDPSKSAPSNFFFRHIYHEMMVYTNDRCGVTRHYSDAANKIKRVTKKFGSDAKLTPLQIHIASGKTIPIHTIKNTNEAIKANATTSLDELFNTPDQQDLNPEKVLLRRETADIINKALKKLPRNEAIVIQLFFGLNGHSPHSTAQIAEMIKTPEGKSVEIETIRGLRASGLKHLKATPELSGERSSRRKTTESVSAYLAMPVSLMDSPNILHFDFGE